MADEKSPGRRRAEEMGSAGSFPKDLPYNYQGGHPVMPGLPATEKLPVDEAMPKAQPESPAAPKPPSIFK